MSVSVYRADSRIPATTSDPVVTLGELDLGDVTRGRTAITAQVASPSFVEVSFFVRAPGSDWEWLGTDDNPSFGVHPDLERFAAGTPLTVLAVARDASGRTGSARADVVVGG